MQSLLASNVFSGLVTNNINQANWFLGKQTIPLQRRESTLWSHSCYDGEKLAFSKWRKREELK